MSAEFYKLESSTGDYYIRCRKRAKRLKVPNHSQRPEITYDRPVPEEKRGGVRKFDHFYPFEEMKPGGSFWVPSTTRCTAGAITKFSKKSGWKFTSKAEAEDGRANNRVGKKERGLRVWRTA